MYLYISYYIRFIKLRVYFPKTKTTLLIKLVSHLTITYNLVYLSVNINYLHKYKQF